MKKSLNSSILAAVSLTSITAQHQTEASTLVFSDELLSKLSSENQLKQADAAVLDFSKMTPETVTKLKGVSLDLSQFNNVRNIILPWFAVNLNIVLPVNFGKTENDIYSRLTIVKGVVTPTTDNELSLNLEQLSNFAGKVIVDTKAVAVTELNTGRAVAKVEKNISTTRLTVSDAIEAIDTDGVAADTVKKKTKITMIPTGVIDINGRATYPGLPTAVLASNPSVLDLKNYKISEQDITLSGMSNLENVTVAAGDKIGTLKVTGDQIVTTNASSVKKLEFTSNTPDQTVVANMSMIANTIAPNSKQAHIYSFTGKTDLNFSNLDLGSIDATATRIIDIFDGSVPISTILSMKITSDVLNSVMAKLNITNLSSFSALKTLEIVNFSGDYQSSTLTATALPASIEGFYSKDLVVRKGTLSANLTINKKFGAATLDLSELALNGNTLTIDSSFTAGSVTNLKINPSLLDVVTTKNLIAAGVGKTITVSGAASSVLTTSNLQNVGTIDLRTVTNASSFYTPLDVDGNNSNLSKLYLPSATVLTGVLSGVDDGEVTVYLSDAYSGTQTMDASYNKTILNFTHTTGTGCFQLPTDIKGLILSDAVKGINVGASASVNEFDLSGLTSLSQLTGLPTSATLLKLSNPDASAPLVLNLTDLTSLTTLQLGSSRISKLSLPTSLTNGGDDAHLDLSNVKDLAELNGINDLLLEGSITTASFPNNPAPTLSLNLVSTIPGLQLNNLDKIPELILDKDYLPGANMWPTVKDKTNRIAWSQFFNYITGNTIQGGINSHAIFDLSGQAIENQIQADALVAAFDSLASFSKSSIQKIIIRLDSSASGTIDLSALATANFTHNSLKIIVDQSTGSSATVTLPTAWNAKTVTYSGLSSVDKSSASSWLNYLNYHFAPTNDKGEGATGLDLSSISLTANQWTALMSALNNFATPGAIQNISLKLAAATTYSAAPAFTTATLAGAKAIIVDITGVKNGSTHIEITGLPAATGSLQVEQRISDPAAVDRTTAASWKGYIEYLLSNISGSNYTLDLTASNVQIQTDVQLTAFNTALEQLSAANKLKIKNINLKIAPGNRAADFTVSTNLTGFTNIASFIVDATGALNGTVQSAITFSLTNGPAYAKAHVTSLSSVHKATQTSWNYYFAYLTGLNGIGISRLDLSSVSFAGQDELTAFLTSLNAQLNTDKATVQSLKLKLAQSYRDSTVDLSAGSISGLSHTSFTVEVDRNGANSTAPVSFVFGTNITSTNTTIKDTAFTSLGSFDGTKAHHWLGYVRILLSAVSSGTTTLDLSINNALEINNTSLAKFITAMNALPAIDKVKIAALKIKLASGDFYSPSADLSSLDGFTALTSLVVERNGARTSATLYDPAVNVIDLGATTVNDPELRTVSSTVETNAWLGYLRFVLNGMSGTANTVDISAFAIDSATAATAFNNALQSLPATEKLKIQTLKLSASATVTLGTDVSGLTNLTKVIVDQTAAPTAIITFANGFGSTQKTYVTSVEIAKTNNAWAHYIDYAMSAIANGGLNQNVFDLTGLTLDNTEATQFLTALNNASDVANVTAVSLKLDPDFGANTLTLPSKSSFTALAGDDAFKIYRNSAANSGNLVSLDYNDWNDSVVQVIDPTEPTVTDAADAQQWLGYLTGVLNDAASGYVLDLRSLTISASNNLSAFNTALNALDSALKNKIAELWLTVTADGKIGENVSGLTNLTKVIVDQTAVPNPTITFANGFGSTQKTYVTSVEIAKTNNAWAHYIDYAMSAIANGGLNQTAFDLTELTLDNTEATQFFADFTTAQKHAITSLSLKLDPDFGSNTLTLPQSTAFTNFTTADAFKIYRNGASGMSASIVNISMNGWSDSVVQVIDPTEPTVTDAADAQQWLGYLTGVLNDAPSRVTLDVSSFEMNDSSYVDAFNAAIANIDSALSQKVSILKLNIGCARDVIVGTNNFDNLTRIELTKSNTNTVTFTGASNTRTYLNSLASVKIDESTDWSRYLNYMLSTTDGGQSATSLNLNSLSFTNQTSVDAFFVGLDALNNTGIYGNKAALTTLRMKLADGSNTITIGGSTSAATELAPELHVIVDPGNGNTITHAGLNSGEVQSANLIVLQSTPAFTKGYIAYAAEQNGFGGTIDLTGIDLLAADGATLINALNALSGDIKAKIKTINLKLKQGNFGSATLTLDTIEGFTGLTLNIDRNGAVNSTPETALVTVTNNTGHSVNLTDTEFQDMSTFNNQSSAHWIGYLTHELHSAPTAYTLDLSINPALKLDSTHSVMALNAALSALPQSLKTKVRLLNIGSSTNGDIGNNNTPIMGFNNLESVAIDYSSTGLNMGIYFDSTPTQYSYITSPFNVMDDYNDWTRFFDYQLNAASVAGLGVTHINIDKRLSAAELPALLNGLNGATAKASLVNLTLNLASDVTGDINVDASGLSALNTLTINTNSSSAIITPTNSFIGKTSFNSASNVKASNPDSWKAYLKGQNSIAAIDIREVELADQAELTAFLTAVNTDSRKEMIATIKLKLASSYSDRVDFSIPSPSGLTALNDDTGVEIYRNGSTATAVSGGSITPDKIKIVDLTASSLTDRNSEGSWCAYLTALIENAGGSIAIDLSIDSDTYLRTNAHVTAFMNGLQNLSSANKLLVLSLKLKLAAGAGWSDITNLGQGLSGFTNLTSFIVDATDALTSAIGNPQLTLSFHSDLSSVTTKTIVSRLNSVDKDSITSWTYFFNSAAMTSVDVSSLALNSSEATAFLAALGTGVTAKADITSLRLKMDPNFGAANLSLNGDGLTGLQGTDRVIIQRNGAADSGTPISVALTNGLTTTHVRIIDPIITDADSVLKTNASSWLAHLTYALSGSAPITLNLTDYNLVLTTSGQATALDAALVALDSSLKAKIKTLKLKAIANVTLNATLTSAAGFTILDTVELDKSATNTITGMTTDTAKLQIIDLANVSKGSATEWGYYLNYVTRLGAAAFDISSITLSESELSALNTALNEFSETDGNAAKLSSIHIKVTGAASDATLHLTANLDAQTAINHPSKFIVDISGLTYANTQAIVDHTGGTAKAIQLRVSNPENIYKSSTTSWGAYLNSLYPIGISGASTVDLTGSRDTYLRNQADVNALMTAIQARSDNANIAMLNVRLAPGNVGSDIVFSTGLNGINPPMNITATGATNNGKLISGADIYYAGSVNSTGKVIIQGFANTVPNKANPIDWTKYLSYLLSSVTDGGLEKVAIVPPALTAPEHLTAFQSALNSLSSGLKNAIQHIHLDISSASFNGALTLGTGISGLNNLQEVTYVRASVVANEIDPVTGSGDFSNKLQRLRTTWDSFATVSSSTMGEYLRYVLMDAVMGGAEKTIIDLTSQTLNTSQGNLLNTALDELPDYLSPRIREIQLRLNAASTVIFSASGLTNLFTVKYFQENNGLLTWINSGFVGFGNATKIRFRALVTDVTDKTNQTQWSQYIDYRLNAVNTGGLGLTTFDLSSITLKSGEAASFLAALNAHRAAASVTAVTLKLDPAFGAASLNLSTYGKLSKLTTDSVIIQRNAAVHSLIPVSITYGGSFTDAKVRIVDPETTLTADRNNTVQQWLEYLTRTIKTVGLSSGLLTIAPGNPFTTQAQLYALFDAMEALDSALKANINTLNIDASSIPSGNVYLMRTGNTALTGFINLSKVIYKCVNTIDNTAVTTNFNNMPTLSRYRVAINDVTNKENANQWVEYLLHKLAPVSLGGLGASTIDISSVDLGNDQVTWFIGGLQSSTLDNYRANITSIKFAVDNTGGDRVLDGGGKTYNNNLKIIVVMNNKPNNTFTLGEGVSGFKNASAADLPNTVVDHRITTARTVSSTALEWQRWLNNQLSTTFGGSGVTWIDLSSTHAFTTQTQLNNFFAGLAALNGTGQANKNLLASLGLKLEASNFGSASARIGYTGSAAITGLKSDIAVTIQRNGARYGAGTESPIVTINHGDINAISSVPGVTVDPSNSVVTNKSSSASWLEYLNNTLTSAVYNCDLDLESYALQVGTSATEAAALYRALEALDPILKAKVSKIKIKMAAGNHAANFTINPSLLGYNNLTSFVVDATGALNGSTQSSISFSFTNQPGSLTTQEAMVVAAASVDFTSSISWSYYFNYLKFKRGDLTSVSARSLNIAITNQATTQANIDAFFAALEARPDKYTVKHIYLNLSGLNGISLNIGTGSTGLSSLQNVIVQPHSTNTSTFSAAGSVVADRICVLSPVTTNLGSAGTVSQWKGYVTYVLEDSDTGGSYTGSDPIGLNLSASDLRISQNASEANLEIAIAELPARLKERISGIFIVTSLNNDLSQNNPFGDVFDPYISEFTNLRAVVIDASATSTISHKPVFPTAGAFFSATKIAKIVY